MNLPDKPSELLEVALEDLEACEEDVSYTVDMSVWHEPNDEDKTCHVCLAGAVLAQTLKADPGKCFGAVRSELDALDEFRMGNLDAALIALEVKTPLLSYAMDVTPYDEDPEAFKQCMATIIYLLRREGL